MPLGPKILLKLVKEKKLVENLSKRELENPEGAGFDIRLGEIFEIRGKGFLGIEDRKTPDAKSVAKYLKSKKSKFLFKPGSYYLVKTIEIVNIPNNISSSIFTRSTLFRSGLNLLFAQIPPGYSGELTFGLINLSQCNIEIELGARIAHLQFDYVKGGGSSYRGQWQGGRVAATKKEKQV